MDITWEAGTGVSVPGISADSMEGANIVFNACISCTATITDFLLDGWLQPHVLLVSQSQIFYASDEGLNADFWFRILQPSDADLFNIEALKFRVYWNGFLIKTIVGIKPQFSKHPLQLN